ncbi:MAG TPA: sulfurtransferase [Rheinheimera sp.]|nr:sulfurtransferase [Rheinheimera sp.]
MKTAQQLVQEAKATVQEISVQQLHAALTNHQAVLIDVREPDEFAAGHIDRFVNFPRGVLEMKIHQHPHVSAHCEPMAALEALAAQPIYLLCRSGARSVLAAQSLQAMGFSQVYSVIGGFQAWHEAGLPVEK